MLVVKQSWKNATEQLVKMLQGCQVLVHLRCRLIHHVQSFVPEILAETRLKHLPLRLPLEVFVVVIWVSLLVAMVFCPWHLSLSQQRRHYAQFFSNRNDGKKSMYENVFSENHQVIR